ncbi:hypothetical protein Tco_1226458 [Tanacetum coccineum]
MPIKYPELLSKDNRWDKKSFKDKLPPLIHENSMFQRLGRYPTNVWTFRDPIFFLAGLKPSWEHGQQRPVIIVDGREMAFRNFMYAGNNEDLSFLPKESSLDFGTGDSPVRQDKRMIHFGSVAARIKVRKCWTRGSSKPPVKRRLVPVGSSSKATRQKTSPLKADSPFLTISHDEEDANAFHLKISDITPSAWKGHLDNQLDVELLDLQDWSYARQAVVDNAVNRRARELLKVIDVLSWIRRMKELGYAVLGIENAYFLVKSWR